jgi:hypothetical protein
MQGATRNKLEDTLPVSEKSERFHDNNAKPAIAFARCFDPAQLPDFRMFSLPCRS